VRLRVPQPATILTRGLAAAFAAAFATLGAGSQTLCFALSRTFLGGLERIDAVVDQSEHTRPDVPGIANLPWDVRLTKRQQELDDEIDFVLLGRTQRNTQRNQFVSLPGRSIFLIEL